MVSVADVDRWDAGDVREVFHAARSRAEATFEARDGITTLPAFGTWGGDAAEAAKSANEQLRKDLDAHGNEALAVARAADQAASGVESVKNRLANLRAEASRLGMEIDPVTNSVVPGPNTGDNPMEILLKTEQLQAELRRFWPKRSRSMSNSPVRSTWPPARSRFHRTPDRQ